MIKKIYRKINRKAEEKFPTTYLSLYKNRLFVKYLISGTITVVVDLSSLYILTEFVFSPDHYMFSIALAFLIAFFVGFFLQKFWTFKEPYSENMVDQMALYMVIATINLCLNFFAVVFLVEIFNIWYFSAQILAGAALAGVSFILYNRFIFRSSVVIKGSILIAAGIFPPDPGGPATHSNRFLEGFSKLGLKTGVITYSDVIKYEKTDKGYDVARVSRKYFFGLRHLIYLVRMLFMSLKYDIIYAQDISATGIPALIVSRLLKKRLFLRVGGDLLWERLAEKGKTNLSLVSFYKENKQLKYYLYHMGQSVLMGAEKVVVPTDLLLSIYRDYYGIDEKKIIVLPNPIPFLKLSDKKPKKEIKERVVLFVGRLVKYKNLEKLIIAFANVYNKIGPAKLIFVGEGPEKRSLTKLSKRLNLKNQIIFRGRIPHHDVMNEIEKSSVCVAPALTEFNPNFILECLSFDKPVLLSKENGLSVKLPERYLLDAGDIKDMENKIIEALSLNGLAEGSLLEAIKRTKILSWEDIINKHLEFFK